MAAHRTYVRRFVAILQMTAVAAVPDLHGGLLEDLVVLQVLHQLQVTFIVGLLNLTHSGEHIRDAVEALLPGLLGHALVHGGPLLMLALGGGHQVLRGGADAAQFLEPELGMLLLIAGGLLEECGDLLKAVLPGLAGIISILVPGLALAGKCLPQVGFGLAAFQFHNKAPFKK